MTASVLSVSVDNDRSIITSAQLAQHVGQDGSTDGKLADAARAASLIVENYSLTQFLPRTYVEVFHDRPDACTPYEIELQRYPVISVDEVLDAAAVVVPPADYEIIDSANGRLRFYSIVPFNLAAERWRLTITYRAGFNVIPVDLKRAALDVGQRLYRNAGTTDGNVQSESLGDWSATYSQAFVSGPVRAILDKYRRAMLA